jgi:hypothetical protein
MNPATTTAKKQCCGSVTFLERVRICGSVQLTYGSRSCFGSGSGSRSCFFRRWLTRCQFCSLFLQCFFTNYIYISLFLFSFSYIRILMIRIHNTAKNHVFLYLFTFMERAAEICESMTPPLLLFNQHTGTIGKFPIMTLILIN